jgi:hypothetical protein
LAFLSGNKKPLAGLCCFVSKGYFFFVVNPPQIKEAVFSAVLDIIFHFYLSL